MRNGAGERLLSTSTVGRDSRTFLEIEGPDEASVRQAVATLGLDYALARFGSVDEIYKSELGRDILAEPTLLFADATGPGVVNRRDSQYDEIIVDRETSEVVREVHESPSQHYGHDSGRRRRECARVPADPQGLLDYRVTR